MPPGISHKGYVCWDDLETPERAKLLAYHQTAEHEAIEMMKATGIPKVK